LSLQLSKQNHIDPRVEKQQQQEEEEAAAEVFLWKRVSGVV
jgi:hypothetical protein